MIILFRVRLEMSFEKWIFVLFFISELSALNFHCFLIVICGVIITSITSLLDGLLDFGQEPTTILQYHNFKSKLSKDAKISISFIETDISQSQDSRGKDLYFSPLFLLIQERFDIYFQFCIWDDYLLFSVTSWLFILIFVYKSCISGQWFKLKYSALKISIGWY